MDMTTVAGENHAQTRPKEQWSYRYLIPSLKFKCV